MYLRGSSFAPCRLQVAVWMLNLAWCAATKLDHTINHYEPIYISPSITTESDNHLTAKLRFAAHGRDFNVHLETHHQLFNPYFKLTVVGEEEGQTVTKSINTRHIVSGQLEDTEEGSIAHGYIRDGVFKGVIRTESETFHVEPIQQYLPLMRQSGSMQQLPNAVIYKESDVNFEPEHIKCGTNNSTKLNFVQESGGEYQLYTNHFSRHGNLKKKRAVSSDRNTCTIKVVADYNFYSNVGGGEEATTLGEMALHIMSADEIFRNTKFIGRNGATYSGFGLYISSSLIFTSSEGNFLSGEYSVDELLETFSEMNFDDACLGHLFTYRDFQGTIGLAYEADPNGQRAGGICEKWTLTALGYRSLNTGYSSFLNYGRRLNQAVTLITTAHEIGHNYGASHDPVSDYSCAPGGSDGNYIMYASATDGSRSNNRKFSSCSIESIGSTLQRKADKCFVQSPNQVECGNGIIEEGEDCDCGHQDETKCHNVDPCCKPGNCTLEPEAQCSPVKYICCERSTCDFADSSRICRKEDECLQETLCDGKSPICPPADLKADNTYCFNNDSVCQGGVCNGSLCLLDGAASCYCSEQSKSCDVCCLFDGECISLEERGNDKKVPAGYPCINFTGYCTANHECKTIEGDSPEDILFNVSSIISWMRSNWYWVLAGVAGLIILTVLLQVTYRRKKPKTDKQVANETTGLMRGTRSTAETPT